MKVLVTGGAGFIGSNIVKALTERGDSVTVIDNLQSGYQKNLDGLEHCCFVEGDIRDETLVREVMQGVDGIFHLAASVGNKRSIDNPIEDSEINVLGTIRVLEAARAAGVRDMVVSSSAGIYGELMTIPIHESHRVEPDSPYGCSKLCEEKLCLTYSKLYDMEVICLRYFNVYGPNQRFDAYGNVIPIFVYQMLRNESITVFGDGEQTRDFIHVDDVVQANLRAMDATGVSGAYNIASGSRITINELVEMITVATGKTPAVEHGPSRPGDVRHSLADIEAAKRDFGFAPDPEMRDRLKQYAQWVVEEELGT